jgi:cytochrome c oxidase subunit 2
MRSEDVLHSLYIRDFRVKQDVVPGRYTSAVVPRPTTRPRARTSTGSSAPSSAAPATPNMNRKVFVLQPKTEFAEWVARSKARWLDKVSRRTTCGGRPVRNVRACAGCHTLDGSARRRFHRGATTTAPAKRLGTHACRPGSQHKVDGGKNLG